MTRTCIVIGVLLAVGSAMAAWGIRGLQAAAELAEANAATAHATATVLQVAQQTEAHYRAQERATAQAQQEAIHAAQRQIDAAASDAAAARAALERLRQRASAAATRGGDAAASASAAASSPAACAPTPVPAELLQRLGEAAGQLAEHADRARIAGTACERAYESLTPTH